MHSRFSLFVVVCALALLPLSAAAHHGWAGNSDEEFEISGTVSSPVNLVGPHATMKDQGVGRTGMGPDARVSAADQELWPDRGRDSRRVHGHRAWTPQP